MCHKLKTSLSTCFFICSNVIILMVNMMKKIFIFVTLILVLTGCNNQEYYSKNLFYMDTVINIKIYDSNQNKINKAFEEIEKLYQKYENLTNFYDENSELSKLNNDVDTNISDELWQLIKIGVDLYFKCNFL